MRMLFVQFFHHFILKKIDNKEERGYFTFAGKISYLICFKQKFPLGMMTGDDDKHAGKWDPLNTVVKSGLESGTI